MPSTSLQQSHHSRGGTVQILDPVRNAHPAARATPAGDAAAVRSASPGLTIVAMPENGPAAAQSLARFLTGLLPGLALNIQQDGGEDAPDHQPAVILTADAVADLARRLHRGTAPDQALGEWREATHALLVRHRRDRRRILLVDPSILDPAMTAARRDLAARLGAILPDGGTVAAREPALQDVGASTRPDQPDPESVVLALALLADRSAADLLAELTAVTIGAVDARDTRPAATAAWTAARQTLTGASLLADQIGLHRTEADPEIRRLRQKAEQLARQTEKAELLAESLAQQIALRREMSDRLAALEKSLAQATAQKTRAELRHGHAQQRIEALLASRSWRVTRPLRALSERVMRRS